MKKLSLNKIRLASLDHSEKKLIGGYTATDCRTDFCWDCVTVGTFTCDPPETQQAACGETAQAATTYNPCC